MSESCLRRAAVALASAAILAVASTIAPSFAQSSRDADAPRLYRIEVIAFSYNEGDPMEELFAHTAARASIEAVDREAGAETFRVIEPYTLAGVFFLLVSYPASILVRKLERRVGTV